LRRRGAVAVGRRVYLRRPTAGDRAAVLDLARASRRLHRPWVAPPADAAAFAAYLTRSRRPNRVGLLACRRADGAVVGVLNVSEIVRGPLQSAYLGYYADARHAGRGYMTEALRLTIRYAFSTLRLHRLEANIQPGNAASRALARRCGFRQEGFSPRYLKVLGRWRDHERWAITVEDRRRLRKP
jgi:[ribosomal protein S5]-alanine N-acetyltransferase